MGGLVRRLIYLLLVSLLAFAGCQLWALAADEEPGPCAAGVGGADGAGGGGGGGAGGAYGAGGSDVGPGLGGSGVGVASSSADVSGAGPSSGAGGGFSARPVPHRARRLRRHRRGGLGTAREADCPLVPSMNLPPPPPTPMWVGLDTQTLRQIAIQNNIRGCASQTGITQSRTIGVAFETWVLKTMGQLPRWTTPIYSPLRALQNKNKPGGLPKSVIPEFVSSQVTFSLQSPLSLTRDYFPNSMFYEVKAVTGVLTPGTSQWQILGLLNVASIFPTVPAGPHAPPLVMFTTTSNTTISQPVVTTATGSGVAVWQQIVEYDANSATPSNPTLRIASPACLNPSVYPTPSSTFSSFVWIESRDAVAREPVDVAGGAGAGCCGRRVRLHSLSNGN